MKEPFVFGKAVDNEYFTDRKEETKKLIANFKYGINTIIISPRRYGKTSLVKKAIKECDDKNVKIVFLDIFSCRNPEDFCRTFADAIIKQTSSKLEEWIKDAQRFLSHLSPRFNISPDPMSELSISFGIRPSEFDMDSILDLPEKIAKEKKCKIVVCIDEFQQIGEFEGSIYFQRKLRSHWQHHHSVSYCLFGSKKHMMIELFEKPSYPFYKFGDLINLNKIGRKDWIQFIIERFKSERKEIDEKIANEICELTEDYSSYVQQLSWLVWIKFDPYRQEEILKSAFEEMLAHCSILFEQQTQNLTSYQMNFMKAIIDGVNRDFTRKEVMERYNLGTPGNINRLKTALIKKELIEFTNRQYFIADPILKVWLRRQFK